MVIVTAGREVGTLVALRHAVALAHPHWDGFSLCWGRVVPGTAAGGRDVAVRCAG